MSAPERHEMYRESGPSGVRFGLGCRLVLFVVVVLALGWLL